MKKKRASNPRRRPAAQQQPLELKFPSKADIEALYNQMMEPHTFEGIMENLRRGKNIRELLLLSRLRSGECDEFVEAALRDERVAELLRREEEKYNRELEAEE